ncbi:MAG: sigma-54 dependent transcriptional regulator [Prevotella sp.]|nr:sigma-54 dependent transcriptional regulator [Prevotella sp.]MCM1074497.1 sigma-54 dependent transcriptional regulator [Ruminococcus sp.]
MPTPIEISPEVTRVKQRFSIVGNSRALLEAIERAIKVAPIDLSVLVTGESGAGKEFFPKIIHNFGARKHAKYIAVNCGAIPEGTIDSELFGHEKGSFTGALSTRKGYFEEADGGTVFLDEVAELPLTTQARLLRVLETGEFLKVGSSQVQRANVRVVAATNVDLVKAVAEGRFREDLYYRLSTVQIQVPSLHDRGQDIILLARKFASDFAEKYMTPAITFAEDARRMMLLYRWPGNVRQLKNVVEQAALFHAGEEVDAQMLSEFMPRRDRTELATRQATPSYESEREMLWHTILSLRSEIQVLRAAMQGDVDADDTDSEKPFTIPKSSSVIPYEQPDFTPYEPASLEENERQAIIHALDRCGGVRKRAAKELNISERTLYRKIKEYGLD